MKPVLTLGEGAVRQVAIAQRKGICENVVGGAECLEGDGGRQRCPHLLEFQNNLKRVVGTTRKGLLSDARMTENAWYDQKQNASAE
jgi:hypothetical protein